MMALLVLTLPVSAMTKSYVELRTQSKIARGQPALFKARILAPGVRKIRLRYRCAISEEFKWVDFEKQANGDLLATIEPEAIVGHVVNYYIVLQKEDGSVEMLYGSPDEPHRIIIERRTSDAVIHQRSSYQKIKVAHGVFKDRFGDDEITEQIALFSALDAGESNNPLHRWGKIAQRISEERVLQMGPLDVARILQSFSKIDFVGERDYLLEPTFEGFLGRSRLKLKIDGLELYNEFDGSSYWNLDALNVASIALRDNPNDVMGESGGLFGTVDLVSPRKSRFMGKIGGGSDVFVAGFTAGKKFGTLDNYWTSTFGRIDENLRVSSIWHSEYWLERAKRPLITGQLQTFADVPRAPDSFRVTWNARAGFAFPLTTSWDSRLWLSAGQSFHRDYRIYRAGIHLLNDFKISSHHALGLIAYAQFVGLTSTGNLSPPLLKRCEILELNSTGLLECRVMGSVSIQDRVQLIDWVALISGVEIVGASGEKNEIVSLVHPSAQMEVALDSMIDLNLGYSSSLRWPTFLERRMGPEIPPPEKLRVASAGMRLKMISDYALLALDLQGRSAWLIDGLEPSASQRGEEQAFGANIALTAKLASAHHLYLGSEFHTQAAFVPRVKIVMGARLNLLKWGSAYIEVQEPSRFYVYYQTRPLLDHFVFETRLEKISPDAVFQIFAGLRFFV
jgi:hypothetical protein